MKYEKYKYLGFLGLLSLIGLKCFVTHNYLWFIFLQYCSFFIFYINYLWFTFFYDNSIVYKLQFNKK